jgi:predicted Zn-ribbon and HTH transcriptional regulator
MATIVEYTDGKSPVNRYPERIISPSQSRDCCFSDMEEIGRAQEDGRWVYQYKRCRQCGFTVRVILRAIPDARLATELRKILATAFRRNVPE